MAGLKSLAQELQSKGRDGDTILAHINPQEAGILKALGGSGTRNPDTGLPEFRFWKSVANIVAAPFKAVNEVIKAVPVIGPAIDRGLVSLDKAVGSAIPGGWNTVAQTALAFTPLGLPAKVGLAALGGSGAFGKEGKFNLQRALMSGAMAYGMNQLTAGLQNAGATSTPLSSADVIPMDALSDVTGSAVGSGGVNAATGEIGSGLAGNQFNLPVGDIGASLPPPPPPSIGSEIMSGNFGNVAERGMASVKDTLGSISMPSMPSMPSMSDLGTTGTNLSAAGRGITNLSGFGPEGLSGAAEAATKFAAPITTKGMAALGIGAMGLSALDEQQKYLDQQLASGSIAQEEYDAGTARINESRARSEQAMRDNPYQFYAGGDVEFSRGDQVMGYAAGGQIKGYANGGPLGAIGAQQTAQTQSSFAQSPFGSISPYDDYASADTFGKAAQSFPGAQQAIGLLGNDLMNMFKPSAQQNTSQSYPSANQNPNTGVGSFAGSGSFYGGGGGGGGGGSGGAFPLEGQYGIVKMATGGMPPRFLSGGGDGMSDSIKANINGTQEARLADGEFVIPADVVSHIGNGSSKAGAKQLYSMMDRVRQARVGTKKQGKQINPRKYMIA
jgi:hypothetical protein